MKARDLMTTNPACCTPTDSAADAARLMADNHCGCLPVVRDGESRELLGVVTDRDIALRGVGHGRDGNTPVNDLMSTDVSCCGADAEHQEVERIMGERQVRRVPVVDDAGCCVGMIAQADLAHAEGRGVEESEVGRVVERISHRINDARAESDVGIRVGRIAR